jgi:hypothetical protein
LAAGLAEAARAPVHGRRRSQHLAALIADDELDLPEGVEPFRLNDLVRGGTRTSIRAWRRLLTE